MNYNKNIVSKFLAKVSRWAIQVLIYTVASVRDASDFILDKVECHENWDCRHKLSLEDVKHSRKDHFLFDGIRINPSWVAEFLEEYKLKEVNFEELIYYTFWWVEPKELKKLEGFENVLSLLANRSSVDKVSCIHH